MSKLSLACFLTILWGVSPVNASYPASGYSDTVAVLRLLHNEEIAASRTYQAYASQAISERHASVESFFAALAWSADIRAENTAAVLKDMGATPIAPPETKVCTASTRLNLKLMSRLEALRMAKRYPMLIERITPEGHAAAIRNATQAWKVDTGHRRLAAAILTGMESFLSIGGRIPKQFYVCRACGAVDSSVPQLTCPVCGGPTSDYRIVDTNHRLHRSTELNTHSYTEDKRLCKPNV